jgi:hypothetical protein
MQIRNGAYNEWATQAGALLGRAGLNLSCLRLSLLGAFNLLMPIGPDITAFIFVDESSQILTSSWLSVGLKVFILPHLLLGLTFFVAIFANNHVFYSCHKTLRHFPLHGKIVRIGVTARSFH